jgi:hypothetical protein
MRHLKKWKLFESNKYESFIRDIEDLSLELSDLGMEVKVWSEIDTQTNTPVPNSYKEAIQVNIKKFPDGLLDIKEFIERASDILRDFNVKCFALSQLKVYQFRYNDIKDDNTVITNLGEYRDVDFYEIYIRFYKPENVYHVIRYNIKPHRGGWSLLEVNINSKEEAQKVLQQYFNKIKNVDIMGDVSLLVISDEEYWNAVGDERYFRENRRLKYTQKLTESNRYDDIRENLNDILYEAQDLGYKTKVDTYSRRTFSFGHQVIQFDVSIYNQDVENKLDFYSLNDCLERIIDYVKQTKMFHNPTAHISYYDVEYDELKDKTVGWKNIDDYIKGLIVYGVKLKFRLKYKLYESVDSKTNIYDDIREIFSDVTDDKCDLFINKIADKHVFILSNKNHIIDYFRFSDIKDELLRLKDYLGTRWVSCGVVFAGDPERIVVDINEYNYDELDDKFPQISNLAVIFNI